MGCVRAKVSGSPEGNIGGKYHLAVMCCISSVDTNEHQRERYCAQFKGVISTNDGGDMSPNSPLKILIVSLIYLYIVICIVSV